MHSKVFDLQPGEVLQGLIQDIHPVASAIRPCFGPALLCQYAALGQPIRFISP